MRITAELLKEHNACKEQVDLFKRFLNGRQYILITDENIQSAFKYGLDVEWANDEGLIELNGCYEDDEDTKVWYQNGLLHRLDGPAVEYTSGYKAWYQNGERYRLDGPAVEYANGNKYWYQNGKLHQLDGLACEYADGSKAWWIKGNHLTEAEFNERTVCEKL